MYVYACVKLQGNLSLRWRIVPTVTASVRTCRSRAWNPNLPWRPPTSLSTACLVNTTWHVNGAEPSAQRNLHAYSPEEPRGKLNTANKQRSTRPAKKKASEMFHDKGLSFSERPAIMHYIHVGGEPRLLHCEYQLSALAARWCSDSKDSPLQLDFCQRGMLVCGCLRVRWFGACSQRRPEEFSTAATCGFSVNPIVTRSQTRAAGFCYERLEIETGVVLNRIWFWGPLPMPIIKQ